MPEISVEERNRMFDEFSREFLSDFAWHAALRLDS